MYQKISWIVQSGKQLWRTIGFPTANILLPEWNNISEWTYKINVIIDGKIYAGVGACMKSQNIFESHIFDFSWDLYGKNIEVMILYKIRENRKFESFEELKNQIQKDKEFAKQEIDTVMTFGTFDIFHEWHTNFLFQARSLWNRLLTVVATDENVEKFKGKKPLYSQEQRKGFVENSWIPDQVFIWSAPNPMYWIETFKPKVVALWYDQVGFSQMLEDFIKKNQLTTVVLRLDPYKENEMKSSLIKEKLYKN
jgi:cytidyltransferase-like protein